MHALPVFFAVFCQCAHSQAIEQMHRNADAGLDASESTLRTAIVNLRQVRAVSCKLRPGPDCDLVALSDVQLQLLDISSKYRHLTRVAESTAAEKLAKIKDAAEEARDKVGDLEDLLNGLTK